MAGRRKIIIDTDPGVDDAITIFAALLHPDVEVIGLTTIFGNCPTTKSTENALGLLELAERADVPVAKGSDCTCWMTSVQSPRSYSQPSTSRYAG